MVNFLYVFAQIIEFAAFLKVRTGEECLTRYRRLTPILPYVTSLPLTMSSLLTLLHTSSFVDSLRPSQLRISADSVQRPFKIPLGTGGCFAMLLLPFLFMLVMLYLATAKTWLVCGSMVFAGGLGHCVMELSRRR